MQSGQEISNTALCNGLEKVSLGVPPHYTEVRLASFHSGGFTTMAVINPPERKLAKRASVHCTFF